MNGEATAPQPVITAATGEDHLAYLCEQVLSALEETRRLQRMAIAAHPDVTALMANLNRVTDLQYEWQQGIAEIRAGRTVRDVRGLIEAAGPPPLAVVPASQPRGRRRGGSHRQKAPGEGQLRLLGTALVAFAAKTLRPAAPHAHRAVTALRAHRVIGAAAAHAKAVTIAAASTAGGVVLMTGAAVAIHSATSPHAAASGGASASGLHWHTSATPLLPSSSLIARDARHGKTAAARKKAVLSAAGAAQPPLYWYPAQPTPQPSPSPSSSAPSGPVEGTLSVPDQDPVGLQVADPTQPATVELDASASGNVPWGMRCSAPAGPGPTCADLKFSATDGAIGAGTSEDVTITFDSLAQQAGGTVVLTFNGHIQVTVNWQQAPSSTAAATPSPAPTVFPS